MKPKYLIYLAVIAGCSLHVSQAQSLDNIFRKFSQCDASFFKAMKDESQTVQALAPTDSKGDALWIKVPNRNDEKKGTTLLVGKPTIAGLPVSSYLDEASEMGSLGRFYYWGFKVKGTQTEVLEKLKPLVHESDRLRKDAPVYVRTELNMGGTSWLPVNTASGVPKEGTVERAFLFEEDDKDKNLTKVFCSLQGSLKAEHLKELRPDIDANEYPAKPQNVAFESVNAAPILIAKLQQTLKAQPLFFPKYKNVMTIYKTQNDGMPTINHYSHLGDGLVTIEERYSSFTVKRQSIGVVLQTKYGRLNCQNVLESAGVVESATLELGQDLSKGVGNYKRTVLG